MSQRLMIFAKAPEPGCVKTRLQLVPTDAAELHGAFVQDVVDRHRTSGRRITVWRAGDLTHPLWGRLGVDLAEQTPGNLGHRMAAAFAHELASGGSVVILGTDSPTLPPQLVDAAFESLQHNQAVVGPACDGGYYLLGLKGQIPAGLFDTDIQWGGPEVLSETLKRLNASAVQHDVLDFWYDVDRPEDLRLMRAHIPTLTSQGIPLPTRALALLEQKDRSW